MYFNLFLNNRGGFTLKYLLCVLPGATLVFGCHCDAGGLQHEGINLIRCLSEFSLEGISTISMLRKIYDKKREALMLQWDPSAVVVFFEWVKRVPKHRTSQGIGSSREETSSSTMFKGRAVVFCCLFIGFQKFASLFSEDVQMQVNIPYMDPLGMNKTPVV